MKLYDRICEIVAEIIPQKRRNKIYPELEYAGLDLKSYDKYIGEKILIIILFGIIGFLLPLSLGSIIGLRHGNLFVVPILSFVITINTYLLAFLSALLFMAIWIFFYYLVMTYKINTRVKKVEKILPDFLMIVSNNINAGMTAFAAVSNAARPEFGILSDEIKIAVSKSLGTESFTQALIEVTKRIKSKTLKETVSFFVQSMRSGGKLAKLLENTSNDLRETQELKKELRTSTRMYVIFVIFIILIATPTLLAISVQFLVMIGKMQLSSFTTGETAIGFVNSGLTITPEIMKIAAYILIIGNSIFASLFLGILIHSKAIEGLKYSPILFILTIIIFNIVNHIIPSMLGAIS